MSFIKTNRELIKAKRLWYVHVEKYPSGLEPVVRSLGKGQFWFGVKPKVCKTSSGKEYIVGLSKSTYPIISTRGKTQNK
jgi:hypothetical protein